ncbi:MAG: hypothetical protein K6F69_08475 [Treponema sp.]|nr:hypothetical protein [Treponema sp.]
MAKTINDVRRVPVEHLSLSVRALNALRKANVRTLGELTAKKQIDISTMKSVGKNTIQDIVDKLAAVGLHLEMDELDWIEWAIAHVEWINKTDWIIARQTF